MREKFLIRKSASDYALYLIADQEVLGDMDLAVSIEEAILGGVTVVQVREKSASSREFYYLTKRIKDVTDKYGVPLIVNDRVDLALAVDAAGVHLGQKDLPATAARKLLGPDKILGVSAATLEEAGTAEAEGADYLGVGALYPTDSKSNTRPVTLDLLKAIKETVSIPVIAIGGINHSNVGPVIKTGVDGVAVISAILKNRDIQKAAADLLAQGDRGN